jgi:hypothetical protein
MWGWLKRLWDRYKYLVIPRPCERCGGPGASLVIDAIPSGKKVDGKTGLVTKTYTVRSADWVCRACRRKPDGSEPDTPATPPEPAAAGTAPPAA